MTKGDNMLAFGIRFKHLKEVVVDLGLVVWCKAMRIFAKILLRFYERDGMFKHYCVQAGYGRRNILEIITDLEQLIPELQDMARSDWKIVTLH